MSARARTRTPRRAYTSAARVGSPDAPFGRHCALALTTRASRVPDYVPQELLGRIADFANLHLPDKTTAASQVYWGRAMNKCQIRKGRKIPQHQTTGHITDSDEAMLRELFKPWNDRLERLLPNVPINWA